MWRPELREATESIDVDLQPKFWRRLGQTMCIGAHVLVRGKTDGSIVTLLDDMLGNPDRSISS
jgi:hypothetical protein